MKLQEFQTYLKNNRIDLALFVHPDPTITYFTQVKPSYAYLLISPKTAELYLTSLDHFPTIKSITVKRLTKKWKAQTAKRKVKTLAVHKECISLASSERLKKLWPNAKLVDVTEPLARLRQHKTPEELRNIALACHVTSRAFTALIQELPRKTLNTEQDVALFLEKYIRQHGGEVAFPTIAAVGKNAATPHHITSIQKLHRGFLVVDFGAQYKNYCADMTRVIFLGTPTAQEKELYTLLLQAQENALLAVKKGKTFLSLDTISRKTLGKYEKYFTHSLGHGIGLEVHEAPLFSDNTQTVQPNVVFTIEPGIYLPQKLGLRIEDTLYFDGKKTKILTTASKELKIIPWK